MRRGRAIGKHDRVTALVQSAARAVADLVANSLKRGGAILGRNDDADFRGVKCLARFDCRFLSEEVLLLCRRFSRRLCRNRNRSLQEPLSFRLLFSHASAQLRIIGCGGRFHISAVKICQAEVAIEAQTLGESFVCGGIERARQRSILERTQNANCESPRLSKTAMP
jgi:hypothetical protein